jgi:hypothetical protein
MTRKAKTRISILTALAVGVGLSTSAVAYYSTGASTRGDHRAATPQSPDISLNAIAHEADQPSGVAGTSRHSDPHTGSLNASLGADGVVSSGSRDLGPVSASDDFNQGDALIGALVATALMLLAFGGTRLVAQSKRRTAGSSA